MNPVGLIFVAAGAFCAAGGIFNWDWFMNNRKAYLVVKTFKRNGARIFYGLLGLAIVVFGVLATMGIIDISEQ